MQLIMDTPIQQMVTEKGLAMRVLLWALLAVLFTAWTLQYSMQHDRLMGVPTYDDIYYFNDGVERLEQFYQHGWAGLLRSCWRDPPHSPFSTLLAFLSFGLFGIHDWAPYAGNAVIVFALIGFADCLLRGCPRLLNALGIGLVIALPITQRAVSEFRSDIFTAILICIGCMLLIVYPLAIASLRRQCLIGTIFGIALLTKPTMFSFITVLMTTSLILALFRDWLECRPSSSQLFLSFMTVVMTCGLLALPYYVLIWENMRYYVYSHIYGQYADIWKYQGSRAEFYLYYLNGTGAIVMLDRFRPLLATTLMVGMIYTLASGRRGHIIRMASLLLITLIALAVPTCVGAKQYIFGSTFFLLVILAALLSLRTVFVDVTTRWCWGRSLAALTLIGATLTAVSRPTQVPVLGTHGDARLDSVQQTCQEILAAMTAHRSEGEKRVFVTKESDPVNCDVLQWVTRKQGFAYQFVRPSYWRDLEPYQQEMEQARFVLAFETDAPLLNFPSDLLAPKTLALARSLKDLVEIGSYPSYNGTTYHLFVNQPFRGWKACSGLKHTEGPYPEWSLPAVRWGTGSATRLRFASKDAKPLQLSLSGRTSIPALSLQILLDGKEVCDHPLPISKEFANLDIPLVVPPGPHEITIQYRGNPGNGDLDSQGLTVLYRRLLIHSPCASLVAGKD